MYTCVYLQCPKTSGVLTGFQDFSAIFTANGDDGIVQTVGLDIILTGYTISLMPYSVGKQSEICRTVQVRANSPKRLTITAVFVYTPFRNIHPC